MIKLTKSLRNHVDAAAIFITLALLLSFATFNAVLFTPALPELTTLLHVSVNQMEGTFIWFLAGYCIGQLFYSPLNNRFGRKIALFSGILLQVFSSLLALYACYMHSFNLLIASRFCLALGSGVGLMMTFTIVSEYYPKERIQTIIAYLTPAFAIVPAIGMLISGYLTTLFGWPANFIMATVYGVILILLCSLLPNSDKKLDLNAFSLRKIYAIYIQELGNKALIISGMLMGCCVAFVYIFSTIVPFVTTRYFNFDSIDYGLSNSFSALGLVTGAVLSTKFSLYIAEKRGLWYGASINLLGSVIILISEYLNLSAFNSFFIPFFLINLGSCFILSCASAMVLDKSAEKSNSSAAMSFINVGTTTLILLLFSYLSLSHYLLAFTFITLSLFMLGLTKIR